MPIEGFKTLWAAEGVKKREGTSKNISVSRAGGTESIEVYLSTKERALLENTLTTVKSTDAQD